jgi:membrane-associated phospholipid phosphatase
MYYDKHWMSDVLLGAAIGTISAQLVHSVDAAETTRGAASKEGTSLFITPTIGGVSLTYAW